MDLWICAGLSGKSCCDVGGDYVLLLCIIILFIIAGTGLAGWMAAAYARTRYTGSLCFRARNREEEANNNNFNTILSDSRDAVEFEFGFRFNDFSIVFLRQRRRFQYLFSRNKFKRAQTLLIWRTKSESTLTHCEALTNLVEERKKKQFFCIYLSGK